MNTRCVAVILLLLISLSARAQTQAPADENHTGEMLAASSGDHVWWIAVDSDAESSSDTRFRLYHHALDMEGPHFRAPLTLPRKPIALAAHADRLWIVFPAEDDRREVYSTRASKNPATGLYFYEPAGRLEIEDALPAEGTLIDIIGAPEGPIAMLTTPAPHDNERERDDDDEAATENQGPTLRLLHLRNTTWQTITIPEDLARQYHLRSLLPVADSAGDFAIFARAEKPPHPAQEDTPPDVSIRRREGVWKPEPLTLPDDLSPQATPRLISASGQLFAVRTRTPGQESETAGTSETSGGGGDQISIDLIRSQTHAPIATITLSPAGHAIVGTSKNLLIIERAPEEGSGQGNGETEPAPAPGSAPDPEPGSFTLRTIDPISGEVTEPIAMTDQPLGSSRFIVPFLFGLMLMALLFAIVMRPTRGERSAIHLPEGATPLDLTRRTFAFLVDFLPGGAIALMMTGQSAQALLFSPIWTASVEDSQTIFLAACIAIAHTGLMELLTGTSFGKSTVGGRVIAATGDRANGLQIGIRNMFKFITILIPPLAVIILLTPGRQQLGDVFARTVVIAFDPRHLERDRDRDREGDDAG